MALHIIEVTPTLDTSQYASGDRLGSILTLDGVADGNFRPTLLKSVTVLDKDKQKASFDILFFDALPTVASADNNAADVSDAQMADKFLGCVKVTSSDYADLSSSSYATYQTELPLKPAPDGTAGTLYALLVARGTPTYAASSLVLRLAFDR